MPASKHRRRRVKRPRRVSPIHERAIGELLGRLVDDRCLEIYGEGEWTFEERNTALEQLIDDLVRGNRGPSPTARLCATATRFGTRTDYRTIDRSARSTRGRPRCAAAHTTPTMVAVATAVAAMTNSRGGTNGGTNFASQ